MLKLKISGGKNTVHFRRDHKVDLFEDIVIIFTNQNV